MKKRYVVTGACGHLGSTIVRMLQRAGESVYGLVLPGEPAQDQAKIHYVRGDVRDIGSLRPLFADAEGEEIIVIHTAGIIDISEQVTDLMYAVNVGGTKNILKLCQQVGVRRLVYVLSLIHIF